MTAGIRYGSAAERNGGLYGVGGIGEVLLERLGEKGIRDGIFYMNFAGSKTFFLLVSSLYIGKWSRWGDYEFLIRSG